MINKKPPFEVTNTIISYVAEIAELVGKATSIDRHTSNPTLRQYPHANPELRAS